MTTFSLDFRGAVYDAMDYLTKKGHTRIAFLGGKEYLEGKVIFADDRKRYYQKYCKHHQLDGTTFLREGAYSTESGYKMMKELLGAKQVPTAVFAASDPIAMGAMKAITESGLRIPEDISVMGFDDVEMSAYLSPALTTIHAPAYDMGQYGVNCLCAAPNMTKASPIRVKMPCVQVERSSCGEVPSK